MKSLKKKKKKSLNHNSRTNVVNICKWELSVKFMSNIINIFIYYIENSAYWLYIENRSIKKIKIF